MRILDSKRAMRLLVVVCVFSAVHLSAAGAGHAALWQDSSPSTNWNALQIDLHPDNVPAAGPFQNQPAYFYAVQFHFAGDGGCGGYFGVQVDTANNPANRKAIFSIWCALAATGPGLAQPFDGEGTGYQTLIAYPWVAGNDYRLRLRRTSPTSAQWKATIANLTTGAAASEIGTITVPAGWGGLNGSTNNFVEWYAPQPANCLFQPWASIHFRQPRVEDAAGTPHPLPLDHPSNDYGSSNVCTMPPQPPEEVEGQGTWYRTGTDIGSGDTTPPTTPANPVASATGSHITLTWTASSDNASVAGYEIHRDGVPVGSAAGGDTSWIDTSPTPNVVHQYKVRAHDPTWNTSGFSAQTSATYDTIAPAQPSALTALPVQYAAYVSWATPTDADTASHSVYIDGVLATTLPIPTSSWASSPLTRGQGHSVSVIAVDDVGNESAAAYTTLYIPTAAPATPSQRTPLRGSGRSKLRWVQPTSDRPIVEWLIYRRINGTWRVYAHRTARYAYIPRSRVRHAYRIRAMDSTGRRSGFSNVRFA